MMKFDLLFVCVCVVFLMFVVVLCFWLLNVLFMVCFIGLNCVCCSLFCVFMVVVVCCEVWIILNLLNCCCDWVMWLNCIDCDIVMCWWRCVCDDLWGYGWGWMWCELRCVCVSEMYVMLRREVIGDDGWWRMKGGVRGCWWVMMECVVRDEWGVWMGWVMWKCERWGVMVMINIGVFNVGD